MVKYEYKTTHSSIRVHIRDIDVDPPRPPSGEGWRCISSTTFAKDALGAFIIWTWERPVPAQPRPMVPEMPKKQVRTFDKKTGGTA